MLNTIPDEIFFFNIKDKSTGIFTYITITDFINLKYVNKFFYNQNMISKNNRIIEDFYYSNILNRYFIKI